MDAKTVKFATKITPARTLLLLCLSIGTAISLVYSIDLLGKPQFEISTWLCVAILLFAIVCAWRVAIAEDDRQSAAFIQPSNSVDSFHARGRDEFGERMH